MLFLFVVSLVVWGVLMGAAFGARKNAVATYKWFGAAMEFAASAANMTGDLSRVALNTPMARRYFEAAFASMTGTTYSGGSFVGGAYPGPVRLVSFQSVRPGDPVPGGVARQPGYVAVIEAPIFSARLPFVGRQYVSMPMRYFAVVKSLQLRG